MELQLIISRASLVVLIMGMGSTSSVTRTASVHLSASSGQTSQYKPSTPKKTRRWLRFFGGSSNTPEPALMFTRSQREESGTGSYIPSPSRSGAFFSDRRQDADEVTHNVDSSIVGLSRKGPGVSIINAVDQWMHNEERPPQN